MIMNEREEIRIRRREKNKELVPRIDISLFTGLLNRDMEKTKKIEIMERRRLRNIETNEKVIG